MTAVGSTGLISELREAPLITSTPRWVPPRPARDVTPQPQRRPSRWRPGRPVWSAPARAGIFGLAAFLYTWDLARVGWGNTFYAAAVKSGSQSWRAFYFGSLDPRSFITVDKPPAALWVMGLSARIFGFSSWSMLLPEALAGVASVMVLYHLVRRWFGEPAAVLASLAFALTPVVVVVFRFNNPDAVLTLLLVLATWGCWRGIETGQTRWLVLSGVLVGLAFLTKSLDALIVVPALGLAYLWCGPPRLARRLGQLGWAALALLVSSAWWVASVELWPKAARPYIGGSTDNSVLNLIFGYNGFSRISGSGRLPFDTGQGLLRVFDTELGGQISWLVPLAVVGVIGGACLTRGRARTDREWGGFLLWGATLLMYFAAYDDARGIFHAYYTVVMAPAVAALAGAGAVALWRLGQRSFRWAWVLPATVVGTVVWADAVLARSSGYDPWLGPTIIATGIAAALVLFVSLTRWVRIRWLAAAAGVVAASSVLAGPVAYSLTTVGNAPGIAAVAGPRSGTGWDGGVSVSHGLVRYLERHQGSAAYLVAVDGSRTAASFILRTGQPVMAMGGFTGLDPAPTLGDFEHLVATGRLHYVYIPGGTGVPSQGGVSAGGSVVAWVHAHGTVVPPAAYGEIHPGPTTLYDVGDSPADR